MGDLGSIPGLGRPPGEGNGYHSSILAWRISWTVKAKGFQRVGHDWMTFTSLHFIYVANKYQIKSETKEEESEWRIIEQFLGAMTGLIYLYIEFNPLGDKYFYHIFSDEKIETQTS